MAINKDLFKSAKPRMESSNAKISVWDKMQLHDKNLYEQEQEVRRFKKRQGQMEMREFLSNQMLSLKKVETIRKT
jgi:hypothetical protein